jgi:hypothetical protein
MNWSPREPDSTLLAYRNGVRQSVVQEIRVSVRKDEVVHTTHSGPGCMKPRNVINLSLNFLIPPRKASAKLKTRIQHGFRISRVAHCKSRWDAEGGSHLRGMEMTPTVKLPIVDSLWASDFSLLHFYLFGSSSVLRRDKMTKISWPGSVVELLEHQWVTG